jgi:drug/metabolite transporter (DMT)-like permease
MATQQIGILLEGAGRSGFITSLYIVFVPLIGFIFGKKVSPFVLIAVVFSLTGLYLININGGEFKFSIGSLFLLGCAIFYALQIIAIDKYTNKCDSIKLTAGQFLISGIIQIPFMFLLESPNVSNIISGLLPILYCGILSSGIGFTIQIYTQKHLDPTVASVIMSLESVFSIIFASIFLKERYSIFEILGCVTIFISVILTQIPSKKKTDAN